VTTPQAPDEFSFELVDPRAPEAHAALQAYFAELDAVFPDGFDPGDTLSADAASFDPPGGAFVVIRDGMQVVGCGGLLTLASGVGEIKRMWVDPSYRGRGLAPRLLEFLEHESARRGHRTVRLDTNSALLRAIALYERSGYRGIERYNDNPYAGRWFEKSIASPHRNHPA
jgi:ribosomal protein S18 acetylase RimI-like enzyme